MYCTKTITDQLVWVGGNDRRLSMFEGVYAVPDGVSYNAYLLKGENTVLFDTVDKAVSKVFFENLAHELQGKPLDFVIVSHVEPDHSATLKELVLRYPQVKIICNAKSQTMLNQFFDFEFDCQIVADGQTLNLSGHELTFIFAPMVHWPEVMMTYDKTSKILFSADAFGHFGALNGGIFADTVNFDRDYLDEARRYYANIVGKYGAMVQTVLKKAKTLDIDYICPLHGFVWRTDFEYIFDKYNRWSSYGYEQKGVVIAYASIYGNTENVAEILAAKLNDKGVKTVLFDVSVTPASQIIAEVFKYSHLVVASPTYNAGIFVQMEAFLQDLVAHNIQNRKVAVIENGSWAISAGKLIKELFSKCKNLQILEQSLTIKSSLKSEQLSIVDDMVNAISQTVNDQQMDTLDEADNKALYKLSYGLFLLTAKKGDFDNGCIINTASQVASSPNVICFSVNKQNLTHDFIKASGQFNLSVLTEDTPFSLFQRFGFNSGRDKNKFEDFTEIERSNNGLLYLNNYSNALISGKVISAKDCGSHTLFIATITQAKLVGEGRSITYSYYLNKVKPTPKNEESIAKKGTKYLCKICGYVYDEVETGVKFNDLPIDWTCPWCKHPKTDFEIQ